MTEKVPLGEVAHYKLYPGLAAKIGAILVHVEEALAIEGPHDNWAPVRVGLADPAVQEWLKFLLPERRK